MQKTIKHKIKNGKLLEIRIEFENTIESIRIFGDFFVYPAEGLDIIEKAIVGMPIDKTLLKKVIDECMEKNNIEVIGFDSDAITSFITEAV